MSKLAKMMLLSKSGKDRDRIDWESDKTRRYDRDRRDMRYDDSDRDRYRDDRMDDRRDSRREMRYDDGRRYPENRMDEHRDMRYDDYPENRRTGRTEMHYDDGYGYPENRRGTGRIAPRMEMYPTTYNAFYDRRGRRHYDNGRYAPMDTYDDGYGEPYHGTTMGFTMPQNHHERGYEFEAQGNGGYIRGNVLPLDTGEHHSMSMKGRRIGAGGMIEGGRRSHQEEYEPLTESEAVKWARSMENADGTRGPHWTREQTDKILKERNLPYPSLDFWLAMNATYSDMVKVFTKHGINKLDAYVDCAVAEWLCDEDAVEDKLSAYYEYVVKH